MEQKLQQNNNIIVYKFGYCLKCGSPLNEKSIKNFCDASCRRDFYQEIRQDNDDLLNEWGEDLW